MPPSDIFQAVEDRLRSGELLPGTQIFEGSLMQEFSVSRTPVRDALLRLHALDYLTIYPRKGIFVARLTVREVLEQLEVLAHLEGLCAQLCAQRMTQLQRLRLQEVLTETEQATQARSTTHYAQANQAFHALLYEGCCSHYLVRQIMQIRTRTAAYRLKRFESIDGLQRSLQEHTEMARAVDRGDSNAAYQAAVTHISMGGAEYAELVRQVPETLFASSARHPQPPHAALTQWSFASTTRPPIHNDLETK
jgi:DNA-binding GntR family transcriptional regulator